MLSFLAAVLADLFFGTTQKHLDAAEAFNTSPKHVSAVRYRYMAMGLFLLSSILLVSAAVFHSIANQPLISEILGWSGIFALLFCSYLGRKYAIINR